MLPSGNIVVVSNQTLVEKDGSCKDVKTAAGFPANGHEARLDDSGNVVSITTGCAHQSVQCDGVLYWDRTANQASRPIDLGDYFDPKVDWGNFSMPQQWMHTNAAAAGSKDNFIVGMRQLSAVASFDKATHALQWVISSEIRSNFSFENEQDKFYNMHDAHQLPNGNIMMYDNGNIRNGAPNAYCRDIVMNAARCGAGTDVERCIACGNSHASMLKDYCPNWPHDMAQACKGFVPHPMPFPQKFSRAVEYALDFKTMTARKVFEFRTEASHYKGAARRLSNGNTLVTCPECGASSGMSGKIYEVAPDGNRVVSQVDMFKDDIEDTIYRAQVVDKLPALDSVAVV